MVSNRRRASTDSEMRGKLINAATDILREQGYAAISYRSIAERLSLKRQIVHYYFESIDELLVLMVQHHHEQALAAFSAAADTENPLRAIWQMSNDPKLAVLSLELAALAARRPAVREVVRQAAEEQRALQASILLRHLEEKGLEPRMDVRFAIFVITSMSQTLAQEDLIGISTAHDTVRKTVDQALQEFAETGTSAHLP